MSNFTNFCVTLPLEGDKFLFVNCLNRSILLCSNLSKDKLLKGHHVQNHTMSFTTWFNQIVQDCNEIKIVIFLTTKCNFCCPYCFQSGFSKNKYQDLTHEVADAILSWVIKFADVNQSKVVHLYLYGGEPTLNSSLIEYFATKGKEKLERKGLLVIGHMFTNGSILSSPTLRAIESGFIKYLQITLDGPEKIHNLRRPNRNGTGTFRSIINNITKILEYSDAEITILSNFDKQNYGYLLELQEYLLKIELAPRLFFTFNPVFKTPFNKQYCTLFALPEPDVYHVWSDLYVQTFNRGFSTDPLPIFEKGPCSYWRKSHFVFDTVGRIYKCIGMPGVERLSLGHLSQVLPENIVDTPAYKLSGIIWDNRICKKCPYLPLCLGGCRFQALATYGDITKPYCHKDVIEQSEFRTIKQLYGRL